MIFPSQLSSDRLNKDFKALRQLRHELSMCAIQRVNGQDLSAFERGMVVGARHTGLCQELQFCWVSNTPFPLYQETTQKTSSQLDTTVESIGVNMVQHPCGNAPDTLKRAQHQQIT